MLAAQQKLFRSYSLLSASLSLFILEKNKHRFALMLWKGERSLSNIGKRAILYKNGENLTNLVVSQKPFDLWLHRPSAL